MLVLHPLPRIERVQRVDWPAMMPVTQIPTVIRNKTKVSKRTIQLIEIAKVIDLAIPLMQLTCVAYLNYEESRGTLIIITDEPLTG